MTSVTTNSSHSGIEQTNPARSTQSQATAASHRLGVALTATIGSVAIVSCVIYLALALGWFNRPFLGAMVSRSLVVDGALPVSRVAWPGLQAGLQRLDHIIAINGQPLADSPQNYDQAVSNYHQIMSALPPGSTVTIDFNRLSEGDIECPGVASRIGDCRISYRLSTFGFVPLSGFFIAPYVTGLISLFVGFAVLRLRPHQPVARLVSRVALLLALLMVGLFDISSTHTLIPLWLVVTIALGATLIHLSLVFPQRLLVLYRAPWLVAAPYVVYGLLAGLLLYTYAYPPAPQFQPAMIAFASLFLAMLILLLKAIFTRRRALSPIIRDQSNTLLVGFLLACSPVLLWLVNTIAVLLNAEALLPFNTSASTPFAVVAPLSLAYAVLQYRKFDTDRVLSTGITYTIMLVTLIAGYFLLVFGVTLFFTQEVAEANQPLFIAVAIFIIAIAFLPVRNLLQQRIDRIYYRQRHDFQDYTELFTHEIARLSDLHEVAGRFHEVLNETIAPSNLFIFLPLRPDGSYIAVGEAGETDISFAADSGIINALEAHDQFIHLEPGRPWPLEIRGERTRLEILNTLLILGLRGSQQINGFISIGQPKSGAKTYNYEEMLFVQNLASQFAIAAERAQVVASLERRVQQLDAFSQVSQAVNFTISSDDLLELISAQTNRLVETRHFYIVLYDERAQELYFAFFQEDGERYGEQELKRWPLGSDLFSEITRTQQPMRVPDFAAAMTQRGAPIVFETPHLKAWMGVPMVAGRRMVGVMAVGTTRPGYVYSGEQYRFFNDMSALAATSIDKARLFEVTERRARQLAALNDISHKLAGELEDVEKLMELITRSAVDILEAEAGSLLLMADEEKKELEFRIAVGPVGQELVGTRFPANAGLAGKVVSTGQPVIVDDPASDPHWGGERAEEGFQTMGVLAVPLVANNQVLGVLEVLNKKDDAPFVQEDVELLTTFAGQAAVAIYNAQLFRMTDQQLSDRVAELEALERIDVELNRSLDATKVAEVTIRWAIAKSGATAGVLGLVVGDPPELHVVWKYGYGDDDSPEGAEGMIWPLDRGIVSRVLRTRRPDLTDDVNIDPSYIPSLRRSLSQLTVPMLSGGEIIALLVLETNKLPRLNLVDLVFVQRLAEHASIALANAQLYAELTRSNESKSEFVSFVAHELKTPMTSIKGYTDLLLMSASNGQLDDQQKKFLYTIRSNTERMTTLVSDLNDVTKLQTNNLVMNLEPLQFENVVSATLLPLRRQIEERQQSLEINIPEDIPAVYGDQNRLIQVLTNLLSNAYKYTPEGGLIKVSGEIVNNRWNTKGRNTQEVLHIVVQDTGIGMSPEDQAKLFTPYFRSDNPQARDQPGTGLGLTITRGIVEQHGGHIWVESELGKGTAFHFTVPIATEAQLVQEQTEEA